MNIYLHIERLVLDGIDLPHHQRPVLKAVIEEKLTSMLFTRGLAPSLRSGGVVSRLQAGDIQLDNENGATNLGKQIAQTVYQGIAQ